jgi:hypothetical protein
MLLDTEAMRFPMRDRTVWILRVASIALLAVGIGTVEAGQPRQAVPHGGGGGAPRASAPVRGAPHGTAAAPRGHVPPGGTANGVAHYGYGYGYGYGNGYGYPYYGYGYPYYGYGYGSGWWGYPCWGVGWYGGWGWPYYGWDYAPAYVPYDGAYVVALPALDPHTPATLLTKFDPSNAEILVDGVSVGFAKDYNGRWDSLTIPPGRHAITFRSAGYTTTVIDLDASPGARYVFGDDLVKGEGQVTRSIPAAPPVAPASAQAERAPEGAAAPPASSSVARGRLKVQAQPEDAAVYLDGEYLGLAGELARLHGAIAVATGSHRIEIVRPGFVSAVETIDVTATDPAVVQLTLARTP